MFGQTIRDAAERFGDRVLMREESGRSLTYADCDELSDGVARTLLAAGVEAGSVVAITMRSGIDYLLTYAAAAKLGAITAGINPSLTATERNALLDLLTPDVVVDAPLAVGDPRVGALPVLGDDPERVVAIVFTSGTTGLPKGAIFRNRQLAAIARFDLGDDWQTTWGAGGHMFASTQFAHVGFMTKLPWYFHAGLTLHCLERWRADAVLRLIDRYRITTLGVVAPQLALMLRHPVLADVDVSCVSHIIAGGAASSASLITEAIGTFGAGYSVRYSSTESGGIGLATDFDAPLEETLSTVGRARPGVDVSVVDPLGTPLPPGEVGELCLRTPTAFDGYWRNPEATAQTLVDG
ncbi:MAG: long-chain fatty acid--CoA ligase, partial [Actinobacteria bacterium]|nr:long-chain fatty acid--CoA ligase [Actinomycetota bacterium]